MKKKVQAKPKKQYWLPKCRCCEEKITSAYEAWKWYDNNGRGDWYAFCSEECLARWVGDEDITGDYEDVLNLPKELRVKASKEEVLDAYFDEDDVDEFTE